MSDNIDSNWLSNPVESGKYIMVNAYQDMVKNHIQELMIKSDTCKCEKCFLDVCAVVFNNPNNNYVHFVTTRAGELLTKIREHSYGNQAEMTVIILEAIRKVGSHPLH